MTEAIFTLPTAPEAPPVPADAEAADGVYELYQFHAERAAQNLTEFFRKPRNSAIMLAAGGEAQEAEDAAWQLYNAFDLETATGPVLDKLGALVGELRSGRTDEDYAAAIRARILVNSSTGRQEDLLAVAAALIPGYDSILLIEEYPAHFTISISGDWGAVTVDTVGRMLRQAKAAGVGMLGIKVETADTMIWDSLTNTWGYDWSLIF